MRFLPLIPVIAVARGRTTTSGLPIMASPCSRFACDNDHYHRILLYPPQHLVIPPLYGDWERSLLCQSLCVVCATLRT